MSEPVFRARLVKDPTTFDWAPLGGLARLAALEKKLNSKVKCLN